MLKRFISALMWPNDPIPRMRETRPAGGVDCNHSAMAGFAAAHTG